MSEDPMTDLDNAEPTLCTCPTPLRPSAIDECQRCRRPVLALLAERYGWTS